MSKTTDISFAVQEGEKEFTLQGEVVGDGSPSLVFLHYWGGSAHSWRPVERELSSEFRCVAYDSRGWGRSRLGGPDTGFAIADLARDALSVIAALSPAEVILAGHSMGGKVAQLVASSRPPQLRGLVLVAPAPAAPAVEFDDDARRQLLANYDTPDSVRLGVDHVTYAPLSDELRAQIVTDSLAGSPAATSAWPMSAITEDVSAGVGRIDVPTLVVGADHDPVEPVDTLRDHVVAAIPGARLAVIPDSGHLIPLEQPKLLAQAITAFLANGASQ